MNRKMVLVFGVVAVAFCLGGGARLSQADPPDSISPAKVITVAGFSEEQSFAPELRSPRIERPFRRPVIGIASLVGETYVRAIRTCGGVPIVLPCIDGSSAEIDDYLGYLDGLLMPGGADIPPSEWGEERHPTTEVLDDDRYRFEKALITAWIEYTNKPLLGICLGSQWVNVVHGGSLIQDIPSEFGGHPRGEPHQVKLKLGSRLYQIFGEREFEVNSFHHQSVRIVGEGLRAVAWSPDGIIEAIETTDPNRFLFGVQWHPEKMMPANQLQKKLIQAFVDAASETAQNAPNLSGLVAD